MASARVLMVLLFVLSMTPGIVAAGGPVVSGTADCTYSRPEDVKLNHLNLTLTVDFKKKQLTGTAEYEIENLKRTNRLILDTRGLTIHGVTTGRGNAPAAYSLGEPDSLFGCPLTIAISPETRLVTIEYSTSAGAEALQWVTPIQTAGKRKPFLYTYSFPYLTRTWLPCQDIPGVRMTYRATIKVQPGFMALMSAINPQSKNSRGIYEFDMPQPIAPYLIALAVGDIEFRATGKRTGVYADPAILPRASRELDDVGRMVAVAESLYGPYRWGRYDVLILPPSFPLGGMENPRLTFATPTIVTGDKSLVGLIAHELGHSWAGNLVTNATWDDEWLNEGVTTYLERRISEAVYGKDFADMDAVIGRHDLDELLEQVGRTNPDTRLYLNLRRRSPDLDARYVVYEKGYLFLRLLEEAAGRRRWDAFLRTYFDRFAFQSVTTQQFTTYYRDMLAKRDSVLNARVDLDSWINTPGLPRDAPLVHSVRFERVESQVRQWQTGSTPRPLATKSWTTQEWVHFLELLPDTLTAAGMNRLDLAFNFTASGNAEILSTWLLLGIKHGYRTADSELERFLRGTGRMKYIVPIYRALMRTPDGVQRAREIFERVKQGYHPYAIAAIQGILSSM